jgi:Fur family transcriptional regulator, zinc uptake regulator
LPKIKSASMAFDDHDHQACTTKAIKIAEDHCIKHKLKFTPIRRKVLEILLEEHRAIGAYAILEKLRLDGFSSQPPVAYRALDFLVEHGFSHKIERLNAFVACSHPGASHTPAFMICRQCDAVAETESEASDSELSKIAKSSGFKIEQTVIEAEGVCHICTDT